MSDLPYRFGFRFNRIAAALEDRANRTIRRHGLRVQGVRVLLWLLHDDGQRFSELATRTSLDPSALSHILRRLARKGWIARDRVDSDNRAVTVRLTPAGRRLAKALTPAFLGLDEALAHDLTAKERNQLERLLDRVYRNLLIAEAEEARLERTEARAAL
ncbi:MAG TPA: MarR family transcriptional regulator [Stellaceae bacterium]|nr:MarR family transcriptional regulator [Stellaceae bacterium]